MTTYYVIKATDENFHRAARYQPSFEDGGYTFPNHYWDVGTEEIVLATDAHIKFETNSEWLAEDTVKQLDKVTA